MPYFEVATTLSFSGVFKVKAESYAQSEEYILKNCCLCIGGNIHSSLPDEDIDWDFDSHCDKEITSITKI